MNLVAKLCKIGFVKVNSKWSEGYEENENRSFSSAMKNCPMP